MATSTADATVSGHPNREDDVALLARLVANALNESVTELRKDNDTRISQITTTFREELSAFREGEEKRLAQFEKAIASWKPEKIKSDPTTKFWTIYRKVADEYDNDLVSQYLGDLDTSLLFAGLFSAVTAAFIVQIIPGLQPDPADLTNVLLLRILQQNTSFGGADPLAPVSNVPISVVRTQSILFASLSVTLFVAFVTVLGKQWILYYTRVTTWGDVVDRGKERQAKLMGLQKWGLHLIMESVPVMLQFALLLFSIALPIYLWDLGISVAGVVLVIPSFGFAFYACITTVATIWRDCPFQTSLSVLLPKVLPWAKELIVPNRARSKRRDNILPHRIERLTEHGRLTNSLGRAFKIFAGGTTPPTPPDDDMPGTDYPMTLSNPAFWRDDPLFTSPIPKDIAASAGFWLLENSTDFSAATAVAAVFPEFQWPSHHRSSTALIRLRDMYVQCFRAPESKKSTRLKALQSAAAYYVLYHTQLIWNTWNNFEVEVGKHPLDPPLDLPLDLPPDLFLHRHNDEWDGDDVFKYLLYIDIEDRSEPVKSARFLSYIAPYWFCGDADSTVRSRPRRLQTLNELIEVLESSRALTPATVTDCILCAGAAMDFPLHPEDLIRVNKSDYLASTFESVVEHIYGIALAKARRRRYAKTALEILLVLAKKTSFLLVDAGWINDLLKRAAWEKMDDGTFTVLLRFSGLRKVDDTVADDVAADDDTATGDTAADDTMVDDTAMDDTVMDDTVVESEILSGLYYDHIQQDEANLQSPGGTVRPKNPTPQYTLLDLVLRNVKTCGVQKDGWQDDAVYGGLMAIRDIPGLRTCLPKVEFLETLSKAMEKETEGENRKGHKPFRVRKAAYDVVLAVQDGWLRSAELRPVLQELDIPRKLHSVVIETGRSDYQRSFLEMMEILSEDGYWHPYLREVMDIWLPLHHEGPVYALRIITRVGELLLPGRDDYSVDKPLEKVLEEEWAAVPGRLPVELTVDVLEPLVEVTKQFKELFFTESERRAILAVVEQVIPSLEKRRDDNYSGPGDDIRHIIGNLLRILREPVQSSSHQSTYW